MSKKHGWKDLTFFQQMITLVSGFGAGLTIYSFFKLSNTQSLSMGVGLTSGIEQVASTNPKLTLAVVGAFIILGLIYFVVKK